MIHYTLDVLASFTGPLFGILVCDYYLIRRQQVDVDDLFTMSPTGRYWYRNGVNPNAVAATVIGGLIALAPVLMPGDFFGTVANFSWFIGAGVGAGAYYLLASRTAPATVPAP